MLCEILVCYAERGPLCWESPAPSRCRRHGSLPLPMSNFRKKPASPPCVHTWNYISVMYLNKKTVRPEKRMSDGPAHVADGMSHPLGSAIEDGGDGDAAATARGAATEELSGKVPPFFWRRTKARPPPPPRPRTCRRGICAGVRYRTGTGASRGSVCRRRRKSMPTTTSRPAAFSPRTAALALAIWTSTLPAPASIIATFVKL